jgi:hypothetical protein
MSSSAVSKDELQYTDQEMIPARNARNVITLAEVMFVTIQRENIRPSKKEVNKVVTVHRPGDDPRKECEECGNARGSNVRYYPT